MIIRNKTNRIITIPGSLTNLEEGTRAVKQMILVPGNNQVSSDQWEAAQEIEVVSYMVSGKGKDGKELEAGVMLEVVSESDEGGAEASDEGGDSGPQDLSGVNATEARSIVGETYDRGTLERWKSSESRTTVVEAIDRQLERISISDDERKKATS